MIAELTGRVKEDGGHFGPVGRALAASGRRRQRWGRLGRSQCHCRGHRYRAMLAPMTHWGNGCQTRANTITNMAYAVVCVPQSQTHTQR